MLISSLLVLPTTVRAEQLFQLKNGLILRGTMVEIPSLKEGFALASADDSTLRPIWLIDDGLRRQYVHGRSMVAADPVDVGGLGVTIDFWQPEASAGKAVGGLGSIMGVSAFNNMGRRQLTMRGPEGPVDVIQGIAEINPRYASLIALKGKPSLMWDMRVATSSIDSETLSTIFRRRVDQSDLNARLELVRFFKDAQRYDDAAKTLRETIRDFPEEKELATLLIGLAERQGAQLIDEAKKRIEVGQRTLARQILQKFPLDKVGGVQKIEVSELIASLDKADEEVRSIVKLLKSQVESLGDARSAELKPAIEEIEAKLSPQTIIRLSDYKRLANADDLPIENRIALALSGWILGAGQGEQNLNIAYSLFNVRDLVRQYQGEVDENERIAIREKLRNLEGALIEFVDRMLPLIEPPLGFPPEAAHAEVDGFFRIQQGDVQYLVQLPPEYDPLRSYPCVLALGVAGVSPESQIAWWCGDPSISGGDGDPGIAGGERLGHASRNGFIVISPVWSRSTQRQYEYTRNEHHRVLSALRDAMRRTAIDADRIFLAGHGEGATAAWDIALAHPDIWAGLIAIGGNPDQTIPHYEVNAQYLPKYLVMGELDGDKAAGSILDSYMSFRHDALVVMYRGRGREFFYDEVPRLFEWMGSKSNVRAAIPEEFKVATMRNGDQFFWWLELIDMNAQVQIDPILWLQAERIRAGKVEATISGDNIVRFEGPCDAFDLWLRPTPQLDLNQPVKLKHGTRQKMVEFSGDLETILEDVRTRADRKRPFWFKASYP
jgi:pimeloyl-ACP methyl ester carboxylesterase